MRKPVKMVAALLVGLGLGAVVGSVVGLAAVWSGFAIAGLGVALFFVSSTDDGVVDGGRGATSTEAFRGAPSTGVFRGSGAGDDASSGETAGAADHGQAQGRSPDLSRLSGLGGRVDELLRLAEEQASQLRAEAKREAEEIVAAARREANAIVAEARRGDAERTT